MSEHRRKPTQPQGGGRAAARRGQQPQGRRAANPQGSPSASDGRGGGEPPYAGRAAARRAAQRGGGRRRGAGPQSRRPGKKRFIDYPRFDKYGWRRWMPSWKLTSGLVIGFVAVIFGGGAVAYAVVSVPNVNLSSQAQNNVYYWDDGTPMVSTGGDVNRQIIDISHIPKQMQHAVVSAENKTFYQDSGVDPEGMARAIFNMAKGGQTQGGSTITQQYVKNARLGDQSQTLSRKFKELFISLKVGTQMSKDQIMSGYLNTSYFGRGAWGIQAAARTYYNVNADQLTTPQSAFLAALLKGATLYDPAGNVGIDPAATPEANTQRVTARWNYVLDQMVANGYLSKAERDTYKQMPMPQKPKKSAQLGGQIGYLVDLAQANFINTNKQGITADDLSKGGYEIYTTFDKKKIQQLQDAVEKVTKNDLDPKKRSEDKYVQFGGASVQPDTGKIVAVYGGSDATQHFTDNADQTGAQVGSTFKPFVLAAAMQHGVLNPHDGPDQPDSERTPVNPDTSRFSAKNMLKIENYDGSVWTDKSGKQWLQANDEGESLPSVSLRKAMQDSINSPFVQLGMDVGIPTVRQEAENAGLLSSSLDPNNVPSFSIGISDPSALRMAGAYSTFDEQGKQRDPYSVEKVIKNGKVIFKHEDVIKQAMPANVANNVTNVLQTVVQKGTGTNAQVPGHDVAGKTGTTDDNKSAWFVGYTPQLSTAISMFRLDDSAKNKKFLSMYGTGGLRTIQGASFPSEIFHDYMTQALQGTSDEPFAKPIPIGKEVTGQGVPSPTPTPTNSVSESPSTTPSDSPTVSDSPNLPTPSDSCGVFGCGRGNGGTDQGGANGGNGAGGVIGGGGGSEPPGQPDGGTGSGTANGGNTNGGAANGGGANGTGGLFAGKNGA
jgi:membrane peptidoglycan carboxypeptidase